MITSYQLVKKINQTVSRLGGRRTAWNCWTDVPKHTIKELPCHPGITIYDNRNGFYFIHTSKKGCSR